MDKQVRTQRAPLLDERLEAAVAMAVPCRVCADIGADHGKLSAAMLCRGLCEHMLVSDISDKALEKSRVLLGGLHLQDQVTFSVADGLDGAKLLTEPLDTCFILGMGGETMAHILEAGQAALNGAKLILSPQTDIPLVRATLVAMGYRIRREEIIPSGKRQYVLMRAEPALPGERPYTAEELILGPVLMKERPAAWEAYLRREEQYAQTAVAAMEKASTNKDSERLAHFRGTLSLVQEALRGFEKE